AENITLSESFTVKDISPQNIRLFVDEKAEKDVPVRPVILGATFKGFAVDSIEVDPETVKIEGPESVISKIFSVKTEPLDITGVTGSVRYRAFLDMNEENVRINATEVEINITIKETK
ncbi:MAG: YbbR-like domain-containing protein, partial [Candidatus Mariimomonas ferrooxydans]